MRVAGADLLTAEMVDLVIKERTQQKQCRFINLLDARDKLSPGSNMVRRVTAGSSSQFRVVGRGKGFATIHSVRRSHNLTITSNPSLTMKDRVHFISHAFGNPFSLVVDSLKEHFQGENEENIFVWCVRSPTTPAAESRFGRCGVSIAAPLFLPVECICMLLRAPDHGAWTRCSTGKMNACEFYQSNVSAG